MKPDEARADTLQRENEALREFLTKLKSGARVDKAGCGYLTVDAEIIAELFALTTKKG